MTVRQAAAAVVTHLAATTTLSHIGKDLFDAKVSLLSYIFSIFLFQSTTYLSPLLVLLVFHLSYIFLFQFFIFPLVSPFNVFHS